MNEIKPPTSPTSGTTPPAGSGEQTVATPPQTQPEVHQPAPAEAQAPVLEEGFFYNVMPATKNSGSVINPKVTISESATPEVNASKPSFFATHKALIIAIVAVLILGAGGYYAYTLYIAKESKVENFLVENPKPKPETSPQDTALKAWNKKYFGSEVCTNEVVCGPDADADHDGLTNKEEFSANTDPNNVDSDQDGLADGDEVHVFSSSPTDSHTAKNAKYDDANYIQGGFDIKQQNAKLTTEQLSAIKVLMEKYGIHQKTGATLGDSLIKIYNFTPSSSTTSTASTTLTSSTTVQTASSTEDMSGEAKLDRDAQRSSAIKNIGIALVKYYQDRNTYPSTTVFRDMYEQVKMYYRVAINPVDPLNKDPYVYTYTPSNDGKDFTLTFYSETQNTLIKKRSSDSNKDLTSEQGSIYDEQRKSHLKMIQSALLLYSNNNIAGNQDYVFPAATKYKTSLVPQYISEIYKDPKTNADYEYSVSEKFDTFTLKAVLDVPPTGTTGYMCNQEECRYY